MSEQAKPVGASDKMKAKDFITLGIFTVLFFAVVMVCIFASAKMGLARCMELASDRKGLVFLAAVLSSLAAIASFIPYIAVYFMIRSIIGVFPNLDQLDMGMVMNYGWLALAGIVANILLYFLAIFSSHMAAFGTLYELKVLFADHITKIPLGYHLMIGSGRLRKIMDENIESVEGFIAHQFPDFVASITAPIVMVIILLAVDWRFGLASLVGIILAFVAEFIGFGSGEMKENMGKYQKALEEMNNASVEYVRGMSVVKAFNQTASSFKKLKEAITGYTEWVLKFSLGWQNCMPAFTTIINNVYLILVPVGILIGSRSDDFAGFAMTFIFYLLFVPAISGVLNKIMYISESFMQIDGNVARMDEILNIPEMPETSHPKKPTNDDVAFKDVSFSYTGDIHEKALENVSFVAKQGQITAIVGPSGGGKSTIANLISRFWDVSSGSITIGGVDVRDMAEDDLMRHVSFVFQDIFLFKQSILDNIRMGNPSASEEQVIAAAKAAQCHEFISKLPGGYHTVVGSKGIHLSGGERQRIAIARAIIKDSPIIVLDEATAFSDPENEYLIQKAFEKLMQGKTVIIIAHRLSTIRNADKIIVMEKGHLIEEGKGDHFWDSCEMNLLKALVLYVDQSYAEQNRNIGEVYRLLTLSGESDLDSLFENLPPTHPAKAPYSLYKQASDTVRSGVIIGLGSRLQVFQSELIKKITTRDEIDLELPGQERCAYFLVTSDQDSTFDFLASLFLSFCFIKLVRYADKNCEGGKLPVPVHVLGEELTACGTIPDLSRRLSVIRSRNISMSCVFQNLAGLQNRYPLNLWQEILGNCDAQLFLGCTDELTAEFISSRTGLASVSVSSKSKQLGTWRISNYTPEYRETSGVGKRPVLTPDEVLRLPIKQALVIIRGQKVLKVDKMDYSKHPEASKLRSCKASAHIPEWRRLEQEQPKPSAAQPKPQAPAPKKPVKKKPKAASTSTNTKQTAAVPTAEAPNGIITTDKDSILS